MNILLQVRPHPKDWKGQPFEIIEHKLDGVRATIFKDGEGRIRAIGKKEYIDLWPKMSRNLKLRDLVEMLPFDTVVDGEITCDGDATSVSTALIHGTAEFTCFGIPRFDSENWRSDDPRCYRPVAIDAGFSIPDLYHPQLHHNCDLSVHLENRAVELKIEGFVLKLQGWRCWYRVKPTKTIDLVVTNWKWGKSKYEGMLGSLEGSVWDGKKLVPIAWVGGWTDYQRKNMIWAAIKGRIMEVKYDKVESKGRLRFPRFNRWRSDKSATQCTLEQ